MLSKPKILFAVTVPFSCRFFDGELRYLEDAGFSTTMVCAPGPQLEDVASSQGAASVAIPMEREIRPRQDLVSLWKLYRTMRAVKPDVVDVSTPKAGLLGSVAAMLARVPCRVYTLRGLRLETTTGTKRAVLWLAERVACMCSHRVVTVGESLRQRAIDLRLVSADEAQSMCNGSGGVDLARFTPANRKSAQTESARKALGLTGKETVIGFVGRFVKDKGIRELVEAFRELSAARPELRLLLVGDFEEGDPVQADVRSDIETSPAILWTGFVADTAPYYALMDVCALPTYREGFPCVPLEAQASEVPVVTTNATGAVDSVQDGVTGLQVPVGDAKALTQAIEKLLRNPELRAEMGRAGRQWMERDFRPEVIWQAHAELYREMLEERWRQGVQGSPALKPWTLMRAVDVVLAVIAGLCCAVPMMLIAMAIKLTSKGPVLHWSSRVGRYNRIFRMPKFRTMRADTPQVATHLLRNAQDYITPVGRFLRKFSLDELPQLYSILVGDLGFVGPRPALYNQDDLVDLRTQQGGTRSAPRTYRLGAGQRPG